jgi:hypothetical protein
MSRRLGAGGPRSPTTEPCRHVDPAAIETGVMTSDMQRIKSSLPTLLVSLACVTCGGTPNKQASPATPHETPRESAAPEQHVPHTTIRGAGFVATVPYEGESSEQPGYSAVALRGSGHEAICRIYKKAPELFRETLAEAVAPFPAENTWRRDARVEHVNGQPVVFLSLIQVPGDPETTENEIDKLKPVALDTYEATQLTLGVTLKQFVLCHPSKPEKSDWFPVATKKFLEALQFEAPPAIAARSTITRKFDPGTPVRSDEYGLKWWVRLQDPERGTIDATYSFGFWGNLSKAIGGLSVEVTDKDGSVASVNYYPGIAGEVQANSALTRLKDGRYAYAIGNGATLFHVRTKLESPPSTEEELKKRMKTKGAYSFTVQKYMPYVSQSHAIDVRYFREANEPPEALRTEVDNVMSKGVLDASGRPLKMEREGANGLGLYQRIYDSAGHLPKE